MKIDMALIIYLLEHNMEYVNISQASKRLKIDYKNVYTAIKRLELDKIISLESYGNSMKITLNSYNNELMTIAEYERRKNIIKNKNIKVMLDYFKQNLVNHFYVLLLFGSHAKKKATKESDIDLMFIVPHKQEELFEKEVYKVKSLLPLPLHCLVFSETQFLQMKNSNQANVVTEAIKNNIILHNIETYYELLT